MSFSEAYDIVFRGECSTCKSQTHWAISYDQKIGSIQTGYVLFCRFCGSSEREWRIIPDQSEGVYCCVIGVDSSIKDDQNDPS